MLFVVKPIQIVLIFRSIHRMYGTNFCDWVNVSITEAKTVRKQAVISDLRTRLFNAVLTPCVLFRAFLKREHCTPKQYHGKL